MLDRQAQALVDILAIRWNIETFFEYDKDLLGSDHYQLMTVQAILLALAWVEDPPRHKSGVAFDNSKLMQKNRHT